MRFFRHTGVNAILSTCWATPEKLNSAIIANNKTHLFFIEILLLSFYDLFYCYQYIINCVLDQAGCLIGADLRLKQGCFSELNRCFWGQKNRFKESSGKSSETGKIVGGYKDVLSGFQESFDKFQEGFNHFHRLCLCVADLFLNRFPDFGFRKRHYILTSYFCSNCFFKLRNN